MPEDRPVVITVVAALDALFGVLSIVFGIFALVGGGAILAMYADRGSALAGTLFGLLGATSILLGILGLLLAWGLWVGKSWAWWITVILSALNVLSVFKGDIFGALVSAVVLYYIFKPDAKSYCGVNVEFST